MDKFKKDKRKFQTLTYFQYKFTRNVIKRVKKNSSRRIRNIKEREKNMSKNHGWEEGRKIPWQFLIPEVQSREEERGGW